MENQLPNFPVPSQNYIAPNLAPVGAPGNLSTPKSNLNRKWILIILAVFILITLPAIVYFLGQQGNAQKSAQLAQTMNSINVTPKAPTATPSPTPTLAPVATNSGTLVATPAAAWKTYTNLKYAYSINYPGDWYNSEFAEKTGSAFSSSVIANNSGSQDIKINAIAKISDSLGLSFADYVKIAGVKEFNYTKLASIKPITTAAGISGYETTWTITVNGQTSESLPITYFEIPSDKTATIEFFLNKKEDMDIYSQMLSAFKFTQ